MLTLSLLRHAKSSWSDPRRKDFDRPLNDRGEKAAPGMGAFMARRGIAPDLILCSPAVRARQTLDLVLPHLKGRPEVAYEEPLYLAAPATMLKRIRQLPPEVRHVMIVGHDPGMHVLAQELAGKGEDGDLEALADKFPTGALAVIEFDATGWQEVERRAGRLALFMSPKRAS